MTLSLPFFNELNELKKFLEPNKFKFEELTTAQYFMLVITILILSSLLFLIIRFFTIQLLDTITNKKEYNKATILDKYRNKHNTPIISLLISLPTKNETHDIEIYDIEKFSKININDTIEVETTIGGFTKSITKLKLIDTYK